ncbi:MAG: agmatinase [Syntrophomonadaceae bacterium]|jgi:agmatinase|nr:agmatinase [Syntrophomonadaceae bacterium]
MLSLRTAAYLEKKNKFLGASSDWENSKQVILGAPMDYTASFRPGSRFAPYRIREVSEVLEEYSISLNNCLDDIDYYDAGDIILPFGNVEKSLALIEEVAHDILSDGKKVFTLGGDHLISLPLIKAYHFFYNDLAVIQMDAHADLRFDYMGQTMSHACVMRRVTEIVGDGSLFQLGVRSGTAEEMAYAAEHSFIFPDQLLEVAGQVKKLIGRRPVYITLDIDVLDPAFAPGTGTPEAGGADSRQLLQMLHKLADLHIVGFDLVEVCPAHDHSDITSILGAKILREALLAY